jgi:hypothetical protein
MLTPKQQAVVDALSEMYDEDGELKRDDAKFTCSSSQETLDTFHELERDGVIQFDDNGDLLYMPS